MSSPARTRALHSTSVSIRHLCPQRHPPAKHVASSPTTASSSPAAHRSTGSPRRLHRLSAKPPSISRQPRETPPHSTPLLQIQTQSRYSAARPALPPRGVPSTNPQASPSAPGPQDVHASAHTPASAIPPAQTKLLHPPVYSVIPPRSHTPPRSTSASLRPASVAKPDHPRLRPTRPTVLSRQTTYPLSQAAPSNSAPVLSALWPLPPPFPQHSA